MSRFQDAGAVRRGSFYVERRADAEIYDALLAREFCYVLAPRQIGKSSLRVRTEARLREQGVRCASIDLTRIGAADVTAEQWYFSLVEEMALSLTPERDPVHFWTHHAGLPPAYRFSRFLLDALLSSIEQPIVISFDEIDVVLGLPFPRDEFFAAMRAAHSARAENPAYERLTFCLFGVATPGELMDNPRHTPFNVGRPIRLDDFTVAEAAAFLPGLEAAGGDARALLAAVLSWTSGHPYMTQRTCGALAAQTPEERGSAPEQARVDALVQKLFLERGRLEDSNLANAELRIRKAEDSALKTEMFRTYRRLLYGGSVAVRGNDAAQQALRLAGMVSESESESGSESAGGPRMTIRNRIFATVFDHRWVDRNFSENPLTESVVQWLRFQKQEDFLLHGVALEVSREWARGRHDLTDEEHEFLQASEQLAERKRAAKRASRERRILVVLSGALAMMFLAGGGLLRERALRMELEQEQRKGKQHEQELEARLQRNRGDIEKVKEEAEQQASAAAGREMKLKEEASELTVRALELEAQGTDARRQAILLRQQADEAQARAEQERKTALAATRLAKEAEAALAKSEAAALVTQKTLETERAGRELVEKQLNDERSHRARIESELKDTQNRLRAEQIENLGLGKHQVWPSEDALTQPLPPPPLPQPRGSSSGHRPAP